MCRNKNRKTCRDFNELEDHAHFGMSASISITACALPTNRPSDPKVDRAMHRRPAGCTDVQFYARCGKNPQIRRKELGIEKAATVEAQYRSLGPRRRH